MTISNSDERKLIAQTLVDSLRQDGYRVVSKWDNKARVKLTVNGVKSYVEIEPPNVFLLKAHHSRDMPSGTKSVSYERVGLERASDPQFHINLLKRLVKTRLELVRNKLHSTAANDFNKFEAPMPIGRVIDISKGLRQILKRLDPQAAQVMAELNVDLAKARQILSRSGLKVNELLG